MIKKLAIIIVCLISTGAYADYLKNGPYLSWHMGADRTTYTIDGEKKNNTRAMWDMAVGGRVRSFRFEFQYAETLRANIKPLKIQQERYMAQFYYDFPIHTTIRPFLNAGLGAAYTEITSGLNTDDDNDDTTLCWGAGAGIGIDISRNFSFDIGYRYVNAGRPKFVDNTISAKIQHHEGYAGVRITF